MSSIRSLLGMGSESPASSLVEGRAGVIGEGDVVDLGDGDTFIVRASVHIGEHTTVCVLDNGLSVRLVAIADETAVGFVPASVRPDNTELLAEGGMWQGQPIAVWRSDEAVYVTTGREVLRQDGESVGAHVFYRTGPEAI